MSQEHSASEQNSTGSIDTNEAGELFASIFTDQPKAEQPEAKPEAKAPEAKAPEAQTDDKPLTEEEALEKAAAEEAQNEAKPESKDDADAPVKFTIKVDGKDVELTPEEVAEHYKSGLRQADYTRKTTEAAQQRKEAEAKAQAAESELAQARQERAIYAQNLQAMSQRLQTVMQDQAQIDWQRLSVENPAEYVKQRHLFDQRQAELARIHGEQARIVQQHQAEQARAAEQAQRTQAKAMEDFAREQREKLLAKLPEWRDSAKAQAEQSSIAKYLEEQGYAKEEVDGVNDHRAVLLARKAMQYDKLMAKAKQATSKVEKLPVKAERPGTNQVDPTDGRSAAMRRLEKTGDVAAAGSIFAQLFG
jgi:hypothetical protein